MQVLFGVDVTVEHGEIVALVGANGAGKTTFLRTLAGLEQPGSGTITLAGEDPRSLHAPDRVELGVNLIRRRLGGRRGPHRCGEPDDVRFRPPESRPCRRDRRAYEQFPRLDERKSQKASLLSGGERQMLALAKALILKPRLLVIDELSMGLAPIVVSDLIEVVRHPPPGHLRPARRAVGQRRSRTGRPGLLHGEGHHRLREHVGRAAGGRGPARVGVPRRCGGGARTPDGHVTASASPTSTFRRAS